MSPGTNTRAQRKGRGAGPAGSPSDGVGTVRPAASGLGGGNPAGAGSRPASRPHGHQLCSACSANLSL